MYTIDQMSDNIPETIANNENETLEIIEIQTGEYLGEDDIVRLEDDYKRN